MGFEMFGSDMSDPQSREDLVDVIAALRDMESDFLDDSAQGFETYQKWAENDANSYMDFVEYCVDHQSMGARQFIAHRGDYLLETETLWTIDTYTKILQDSSQSVRFGAAENIEIKLAEADSELEEKILKALGLSGLKSFLVLLKDVCEEKKSARKSEN